MTRRLVLGLFFSWFAFTACSGAPGNPGSEGEGEGEGEGEVVAPDLRINEVVASGAPDWVEILNVGDTDVALEGLTLTDDPTTPAKGVLTDGIADAPATLAPGARVVVECADEGIGFKLGSDEQVHLFISDTLIDEVDWAEGEAPEGGSYARIPDGTGEFTTRTPATPGVANE
jgi:Lamin Tail Domain